jgi:hypothetical protein
MNIDLSIERIMLDGITIQPGQHSALSAAVRTELMRLLREGGLAPGLSRPSAMARVDAPTIESPAAADPVTLGRDIARAVYGGVRQ